jgi:CRISPR system Cascade subunit CasA
VAGSADRELKAGAIDRVDWAASQAQLRTAELAEVDALRRLHASVSALEDALRRPLDGPEQALAAGWASGANADTGPKEAMQ